MKISKSQKFWVIKTPNRCGRYLVSKDGATCLAVREKIQILHESFTDYAISYFGDHKLLAAQIMQFNVVQLFAVGFFAD